MPISLDGNKTFVNEKEPISAASAATTAATAATIVAITAAKKQ